MFNLHRFSQSDISNTPADVVDTARDIVQQENSQISNQGVKPPSTETGVDGPRVFSPEEQGIIDNLTAYNFFSTAKQMAEKMNQNGVNVWGVLNGNPEFQRISKMVNSFDINSIDKDKRSLFESAAKTNDRYTHLQNSLTSQLNQIYRNEMKLRNQNQISKQQQPTNVAPVRANNSSYLSKISQIMMDQQPQIQPENAQNFPIKDVADLMNKFMQRLLSQDPSIYSQAAEEILSSVHGELQEEDIKSILETLRSFDYDRNQAEAAAVFGKLYEMLPAHLKEHNTEIETMSQPDIQTMAETKIKGIVKFNLSDHILNNNTKTASQHFGTTAILYGPEEKRICPKLRGRNVGDVVSESICRNHCLDGIVIDDNKTICGEALWRAHVMDKQTREYVDEDGNVTGGYIEKRFEVNHNVPEENKIRLKPGEIRKPRPASMGNLESRMQDMRQKQAKERGYRPDSNTGDPFVWCTDVDQNNVNVSQKERDRRETASGHKLVEYTNKDKQENNPKVLKTSFNLNSHKKQAQVAKGPFPFSDKSNEYKSKTTEQLAYAFADAVQAREAAEGFDREGLRSNSGYYADESYSLYEEAKKRPDFKQYEHIFRNPHSVSVHYNPKSSSFNFKNFKKAQFDNRDLHVDEFGRREFSSIDPDQDDLFSEDEPVECPQCGGMGHYLGTLGRLKHYRCEGCGWDFPDPIRSKSMPFSGAGDLSQGGLSDGGSPYSDDELNDQWNSEVKEGIMTQDVHQLGTSLRLQKGQRVRLIPTTNLPQNGEGNDWFAQPLDGMWSDGIEHGPDDSIAISNNDVQMPDNNQKPTAANPAWTEDFGDEGGGDELLRNEDPNNQDFGNNIGNDLSEYNGENQLNNRKPMLSQPPKTMPMNVDFKPVSMDDVKKIGQTIGIDWNSTQFNIADFKKGIETELEHGSTDPQTDVTHNNLTETAKIALAHLKERPDYYNMLSQAESQPLDKTEKPCIAKKTSFNLKTAKKQKIAPMPDEGEKKK